MAINIKLEEFEGPMDLLLHLIKKAEVDIYDIPIFEITEQYIAYLNAMEELDLNIASEFLVMAATLLEIKSRMLVPNTKTSGDEEDEMDPRQELIDKLVQYKQYKEFAEHLRDLEGVNTIFFKEPEIIDDIEDDEVFFKNITFDNLMKAFNKVVKNYQSKFNKNAEIPKDINIDKYKVEDKMEFIKKIINDDEGGRVPFENLFAGSEEKIEIVVTFLALLELIRLRIIRAIQYDSYGEIFIERQEEGTWKIS